MSSQRHLVPEARSLSEVAVVTGASMMVGQQPLDRALCTTDRGRLRREIRFLRQLEAILPTPVSIRIFLSGPEVLMVTSRPVREIHVAGFLSQVARVVLT
jgi:hypothetical protein